jgi:hypothetical protein
MAMATKIRTTKRKAGAKNAAGLRREDYPAGKYGNLAFAQGWPVWGASPEAKVRTWSGGVITVREMFDALATVRRAA